MRKQNYLNNKDMLKEIHKSKLSFCSLVDDNYSRFDVIVETIEDINNPEFIQQAKEAFLTNSLSVRPLLSINGKKIGSDNSFFFSQEILNRFF